jgi:hypothetical protein
MQYCARRHDVLIKTSSAWNMTYTLFAICFHCCMTTKYRSDALSALLGPLQCTSRHYSALHGSPTLTVEREHCLIRLATCHRLM